jgi:ABC-2 type transport system permease protein
MASTTTGRGTQAAAEVRVTQARVAASEWIKLRSLRSTVYTLAASVIMMVGLGLLLAVIALVHLEAGHGLGSIGPASLSLYGAYPAQLTIGALGVLLVTGEYATGMIRATLTAVPRRLPVLWAKLGVFAAVAAVTAEISLLVTFLSSQAILSGQHAGTSLSHPGVLRAVLGTGLYLTIVGLLGMALGSLIRNTAGALATLFGVVLILPVLWDLVPAQWAAQTARYLPSNAGQAILQVHPAAGTLAPWTGLALFGAYTAAAIAAAALLLKRRDA